MMKIFTSLCACSATSGFLCCTSLFGINLSAVAQRKFQGKTLQRVTAAQPQTMLPFVVKAIAVKAIAVKTIAVITLAVCLLIALAGCTNSPSEPVSASADSTGQPKTLLVTVAVSPHDELQAIQQSLANDYHLTVKNDWPLTSLDIYCFIYQIAGEENTDRLIAAMAKDPRVDSVQLIRKFEVLTNSQASSGKVTIDYDDQLYSLQYGLKILQADRAHQWSTGKAVQVGVIDTGIEASHTDLGSVSYTRNFVGKPTDTVFAEIHGTAVAGIIAAKANNSIGIVGIAPDAEVIGLRGCWQPEGTTHGSCNSLSLAKAIDYANIHGIDILNLSLQGPYDPIIERLLANAIVHNTVVIAAYQPSENTFPASQQGVIAVTSDPSIVSIHPLNSTLVAAPGIDILTTVPASQYDLLQGSSLAAAHISGVVALIRELRPDLSPKDIATLLTATTTATGIPHEGKMVNACKALAFLLAKAC
jgi:subtilisin family serine protease